jgi:hypothetical protein
MLIRLVKTKTFSELTHKNEAVTVWPFKNGDLSSKKQHFLCFDQQVHDGFANSFCDLTSTNHDLTSKNGDL